ncbi:MAG: cyclase family protein [Bacteroidetes bacterium]|nr:cyclase family protein [Bacteroidota bacterium]
MEATISFRDQSFRVDLSQPIDISIPLHAGKQNVNAFHLPPVKMEPFRIGNFIGSVNEGGACNVNNIFFNPHGNGTHTECVGHISKENFTINQCLKRFFFFARLVSVTPKEQDGNKIITLKQIKEQVEPGNAMQQALVPEALIIRTLPNEPDKLTRQYSGTDPAHLHHEAAKWMAEKSIEHILLDLPSVDREDDGGKLLAHHEFWKYPHQTRMNATITELVYVPSSIPDGYYFLNIQIASFENDASPSKPVLFKIS